MRHFTPAVFMCSLQHPSFTRRHNGWFDWTRWIIGGRMWTLICFLFCESSRFVHSSLFRRLASQPEHRHPHHFPWWNSSGTAALCWRFSIPKTALLFFAPAGDDEAGEIKSINESRFRRRGDPGLSEMGKQSLSSGGCRNRMCFPSF